MRKAGELDILRGTVCPACASVMPRISDATTASSLNVSVEVAHTEQKNGIRMFLFHLDVLLHQRCFHYFIGHERYVICRISFLAGRDGQRGVQLITAPAMVNASQSRRVCGL